MLLTDHGISLRKLRAQGRELREKQPLLIAQSVHVLEDQIVLVHPLQSDLANGDEVSEVLGWQVDDTLQPQHLLLMVQHRILLEVANEIPGLHVQVHGMRNDPRHCGGEVVPLQEWL